ncbi:MAG TPA: FAD-binding protein [Polyangiaceae bacterium]|nr:FAD-binding protein [Polyangiaceae bacterium]
MIGPRAMRAFDAVVIGAGPAGLSAAAELAAGGRCLVLERGPPAGRRDRGSPDDLLSGVGGAGLFSDGKHSFFPATTALWALPDRAALAAAFERSAALLRRHGVAPVAPPVAPPAAPPPAPGAWRPKDYPSLYVPFGERLAMIDALWAAGGERWHGATALAAGRAGAEIVVRVGRGGGHEEVRCARLVVATGRWSPRWLRPWLEGLGASFGFRRVEFGVRIEAPAGSSLFARLPGVDGKLRFVEPDAPVEARTFCTCREGEVVFGRAAGMGAFSGRADGPKTGRSNVGLLVRTDDPALGRDVEAHVYRATPAAFDLGEWLARGAGLLAPTFGEAGARAIFRAILRLLDVAPGLRAEGARVYAPCVEGVGDYPLDDGSLGVADGVWVAGDACGRFRGIVAGLVSGRYAALRALRGGG